LAETYCFSHLRRVDNKVELVASQALGTVIVTNPQQQQLRPYEVTVAERNGKTSYVYADPTHCQIFVGTRYQRYQQLRLANNLARDQLATAQLNNMTAMTGTGGDLGIFNPTL